MIRTGTALALATLLALAACGGGAGGSPDARPTLARCEPRGFVSVGEALPSCEFERLEGGVLRLGDLRGKPAVLNFWASWCAFCIKEMPDFQRVYSSVSGKVTFVGADLLGVQGETRGAAEKFARSTGVRYPLIYDEGGLLYAHFSARLVMPVTVFIDAGGVVAHRQFGPLDEEELRDLLARHLAVR